MDAETREKEIQRLMREESRHFEQADAAEKTRKRCESEGYSAQHKALALMKEAEDEKIKTEAYAAGFEAAREMAAKMADRHRDEEWGGHTAAVIAAAIRALKQEPDHA